MRLFPRPARARREPVFDNRLVWQAASLLLAYPDEARDERFATAEALLGGVDGKPAELLGRALGVLRGMDVLAAATDYTEIFDMRRRTTMYLTYWTAGDTRNRGRAILGFASAYRQSGVTPPASEGPDHLPVVLEFAATVDAAVGRRMLLEYRAPIDVLADALTAAGSPYSDVIAAVCATLPPSTDQEVQQARQLAESGPPEESVGLEPFTLTVPPRRTKGE